MAEDFDSKQIPEITTTPPSTPMPTSLPLHLSGFLNGDTIQVEGDTGTLHFSVKFNIHNNTSNNQTNIDDHFPSLNSLDNNINSNSCHHNSSVSSYMTPKSSTSSSSSTDHDHHQDIETDHIADSDQPLVTRPIMTRLRSGAISQVKYLNCPRINSTKEYCKTISKHRKMRQRREKEDHMVLEKLLQRRSCPVRPCSSYIYFVMASWGSVKSLSFGEASRRLSQMWCKLTREDKKIYEDVALKDSARYKRQCTLLNYKD